MIRHVRWQRPIEDAVVRHSVDERIMQALSSISMTDLHMDLLLAAVGGISDSTVSRRHGLDTSKWLMARRELYSMLRDQLRNHGIGESWDEEKEFSLGRVLEEVARRHLQERRPRCGWCHRRSGPLRLEGFPGRPRKWCSNACRQAAYRTRRDTGRRTTPDAEQARQ